MTVSDFNPQNKINIHESVLILKTEEVDKQMREKRQIFLLEFQATNADGKREMRIPIRQTLGTNAVDRMSQWRQKAMGKM